MHRAALYVLAGTGLGRIVSRSNRNEIKIFKEKQKSKESNILYTIAITFVKSDTDYTNFTLIGANSDVCLTPTTNETI